MKKTLLSVLILLSVNMSAQNIITCPETLLCNDNNPERCNLLGNSNIPAENPNFIIDQRMRNYIIPSRYYFVGARNYTGDGNGITLNPDRKMNCQYVTAGSTRDPTVTSLTLISRTPMNPIFNDGTWAQGFRDVKGDGVYALYVKQQGQNPSSSGALMTVGAN
jgi:hypothetical protein